MKTNMLIFCMLAITWSIPGYSEELTVKAQLEKLNRYWEDKDLNYPVLKQTMALTDEVTLIQTHLSLVEKTLRRKNTSHLTEQQKLNRLTCLDILHEYRVKGVFPKNLYHSSRTPYFIDEYNTACAVGQLLISTGFEAFAHKVRSKNNNAYIAELNAIYPEIKSWAHDFGFTVEELAWIQPCYCASNAPATINVTCHGGYNGYFMPDLSAISAPHTYTSLSKWDGSAAVWKEILTMCGPCGLTAGKYKFSVKDAANQTHDFYATLTEPPPATIDVAVSGNAISCNASATLTVNGGFPPYSYHWPEVISNTNIASGLCNSTYNVIVADSKYCYHYKSFTAENPTSVAEISYHDLTFFPRPAQDKLYFTRNTSGGISNNLSSISKLSITNALGQLVYTKNKLDLNEGLDVSFLSTGVYYLKIEGEKGDKTFKVLKE